MKTIIYITIFMCISSVFAQEITADEILDKVDKNMTSENRVFKSKMIIHSKRNSRTVESKSWGEGDNSFSEYTAPAREKGTKMLKLEDKLWIFSPQSDRVIQISGHMLKQSVMGSDLSYEDMMENNKLKDAYDATIITTETYEERECYVLELVAKIKDVSYYKRKQWIDKDRFIPLKEELYAKSGKLLKKTELSDIHKIEGRWFPMKITFKDMLKRGDGTEFIIVSVKFNQQLPKELFTKASLRK